MRESVKGILGKALALFVTAVLVSAGALPILGAKEDALASADDNSWQVVSGGYDAAHKTSQGIAKDDLDNCGFIESSDGNVRVTKTVEPTDVEDEFIMRLSVDTCAVSGQVVDYGAFFQSAPYEGLTSNSVHGTPLGTVVSDIGGSGFPISADPASKLKMGAYMTIKDPTGAVLVNDIRVTWGKGNNVTFYLKIDDSHYVLMGVSVRQDTHNTLQLSKEAWDLINNAIAGKMHHAPAPSLESVTDVMGDNIEYLGPVNVDSGNASFDGALMLIWRPQYSPSCTVVEEDPVYSIVRDENTNAIVKEVMTQKTWYYGAASLAYKVRLKTDGIASSYDSIVGVNSYFTNNRATLDYACSNFDKSVDKLVESKGTIDFPKPEVKGITYDLRVLKNDEDGKPLAGATFELKRTWTDSDGRHTDPVPGSLTSDENGYVTVTGLPWGEYTLTETKAPDDFVISEDASCTFNLCYTTDRASLMASTLSSPEANRAMLAADVPTIVNPYYKHDVTLLKVDANDTSKPLKGAKFKIWRDNGDGAFAESEPDVYIGEFETDEYGKIGFSQLRVGTYYFKETYTPSGYAIDSSVHSFHVYSKREQAEGGAGNMIQVGLTDGTLVAPETPNQVTVADRPNPQLPATGGPGIGGLVTAGVALVGIGAAWFALMYAARRKTSFIRARNGK